ncbi:glutamine ABC transporter substrate-binding protein [Dulcicalothrix desertica PCC 7102]|uniref:Glutamine ABC transporter substrate-binding protein n=1 Tax=Dulcicalothrix desertica PCC 7102 TaxID=232991 RepID=A0A433VHK1_9CYAN|nr:transporter substrate-binding domain-containing protein [Dulcicalothrix desertica]RUT05550.1 glutamine ABC transporter substrate-binding protein [Dulcicalothrix desertica PCC 7102]TWH54644.1 polar amino acid transport system substrate-binding protein [Dulcicalothrix desertica PCC 7102]
MRFIVIIFFTFAFCLLPCTKPCGAAQLEEIQQRGHIRIAVKDNLPPLAFRDQSGNLQGLEIDLAQRLAQDLLGASKASKLKPVLNRDRISQVLDNKVDIAIARVTATPSRARIVNFSIPYYLDSTVLVTKDTSLQSLDDFKQLKIAVLAGSSTIAPIKYFIPNADLVGVNSYIEAQNLLESNKIDAFGADATVLSGWVRQYPQYRLLNVRLSTEPLCVVIAKGLQNDKLRRQIDILIASYQETGWLTERIKYWGLPPSSILDKDANRRDAINRVSTR